MKIKYKECSFQKRTLKRIDAINEILEEYNNQGFQMTIRQLYYQMVSREIIPFDNKEYDKLITLVSKARNAGLIDWSYIADRSRDAYQVPISENVEQAMKKAADSYNIDIWNNMPIKPIIWFEKAGLSQIIGRVASQYNIEYMSTRGESSLTWLQYTAQKAGSKILYLGDHDGHGVQISDGMERKVNLYSDGFTGFKRIAISLDQGEAIDAPKIPLKDVRNLSFDYIKRFGVAYGYEIDAMSPVQLSNLIKNEIQQFIDLDPKTFQDNIDQQKEERNRILEAVS